MNGHEEDVCLIAHGVVPKNVAQKHRAALQVAMRLGYLLVGLSELHLTAEVLEAGLDSLA